MKTIKNLLLEKHERAEPQLDDIRRRIMSELRSEGLGLPPRATDGKTRDARPRGGIGEFLRTGTSRLRSAWRELFEGIPFVRGQLAALAAVFLLSGGLNLLSSSGGSGSGTQTPSSQLMLQAARNRKELLALINPNNDESGAPPVTRPRSHADTDTKTI
jgi:hypothetical protein